MLNKKNITQAKINYYANQIGAELSPNFEGVIPLLEDVKNLRELVFGTLRGPTGPTGPPGPRGDDGISQWEQGDDYIYFTDGNVSIGKSTNSGSALEVIGDTKITGNLFLQSVKISNGTGNNLSLGKTNLNSITTGTHNLAVGVSALQGITSGSSNVGMGSQSLSATSTGSSNTGIGQNAGTDNTGSFNTYVGAETKCNSNTFQYSTALGYGSTLTDNHQITVGRATENVVILGNISMGKSAPTTGYKVDISGDVGITGNTVISRYILQW